ncbi:DUF1828 domain-containing protein [Aestuariivirga sp.]|uniref:DUF1828 domain-containing protein n=1 Tax=Aestuariivirga sp. TaxID=2650926 RepID=UPI0025BB8466|nr:DUF1828 domain-containing protein [Aestuariivirga sp.]MCA3556179.1 DUF1828 domain-containing protein [Aestuariivirga sp.]
MNRENFCEAICSELQLRTVPLGYVLKTPFLKDDGESIAIYIRRSSADSKFYRLEDDGETVAALEAVGVDFDSESRLEALADLLRTHQASYDEAGSVLHTEYFLEDEIPARAISFMSLMNRVFDLSLLAKNRVRSRFKEDLIKLVEAQFSGTARIRIGEPIRETMKDYIVDIVVEGRDGRILAIFAGTSEVKALEALLFVNEQKKQLLSNVRAMLVLEKAKPADIKERTLSRVINSEIRLASMDGEAVAVKQKLEDSLLH